MGRRLWTLVTTPSLYFVTTTFVDWRQLMALPATRDAVEYKLFSIAKEKASALMGYVLMSSHIHLLVGCVHGGYQLSKFMRSFKSLTSRQLFAEWRPVWMRRFDDLVITTEKQFRIKLDYIHDNPVRAGLAKTQTEWKWSSAGFWFKDEPRLVLTKSWEWLSREDT